METTATVATETTITTADIAAKKEADRVAFLASLDPTNPEHIKILMRSQGRKAGGTNVCSICGKAESRNAKAVNEACPTHAQADADGVVEKLRQLNKVLSSGKLANFEGKYAQFNAQKEAYEKMLIEARQEHEKYVPANDEGSTEVKGKLAAILSDCLALLGVKDGVKDATNVEIATFIRSNLELKFPKAEEAAA